MGVAATVAEVMVEAATVAEVMAAGMEEAMAVGMGLRVHKVDGTEGMVDGVAEGGMVVMVGMAIIFMVAVAITTFSLALDGAIMGGGEMVAMIPIFIATQPIILIRHIIIPIRPMFTLHLQEFF